MPENNRRLDQALTEPYPTWNRLRGIDDPERTGGNAPRNG